MKYVWVVGIVVCVTLAIATSIVYPKSLWQKHRQMIARYIFQSDYIQVRDQRFRNPLIIDSVRLSKPGYIRVQIADDFGEIGEDMAQSYGVLPAGEYKNVKIDFDQDPVFDSTDSSDAPVRKVWAIVQYNIGRKPGDVVDTQDTYLHGNRYYPAVNVFGDIIADEFTLRY